MNCDFSSDDRTCPRCGFASPVARLYVDCDMPLAVKQAAARVAEEAAKAEPALAAALPALPSAGPGTELKKLLASWPWRLVATDGCACSHRALLMNEHEAVEPGWCAANIDTIVGWLREEASARRLPFVNAAGRMLVRRAIKNAKRAAAS